MALLIASSCVRHEPVSDFASAAGVLDGQPATAESPVRKPASDELPPIACPPGNAWLELVSTNDPVPTEPCECGPIHDSWQIHIEARSTETVTRANLFPANVDAEWTPTGVRVLGIMTHRPLPSFRAEEARRIGAIAASVVGWPGKRVAARSFVNGEEVRELEEPIARIVELRLRSEKIAVTVNVRFREGTSDELTFAVAWSATTPDTAKCLGCSSVVTASGPLVLRASDGALLELQLRGRRIDRQPLCAKGPQTESEAGCTGEMSFSLAWVCHLPVMGAMDAADPSIVLKLGGSLRSEREWSALAW